MAETLTGIGYADRYDTEVYDEIDGPSVDRETLTDGSLRIAPERPLGGKSVD